MYIDTILHHRTLIYATALRFHKKLGEE